MSTTKAANDTPWAVVCPTHGKVVLTEEQYNAQMDRPDNRWYCPICTQEAYWDDDHHDDYYDREEDAASDEGR